jgi:hypothetical protein
MKEVSNPKIQLHCSMFHACFPILTKNNTRKCVKILKFATPYRFTYQQLWPRGGKKKASSYVPIEMHSSKWKQPIWEHKEIIAFIQTKLDEHIATLNKVDPWDWFEIFVTKWKKKFAIVMSASSFNTWEMTLPTKTKGEPTLDNSRRFFYHVSRIRHNGKVLGNEPTWQGFTSFAMIF